MRALQKSHGKMELKHELGTKKKKKKNSMYGFMVFLKHPFSLCVFKQCCTLRLPLSSPLGGPGDPKPSPCCCSAGQESDSVDIKSHLGVW